MRRLIVLAAALAIASCSGSNGGPSDTAMQGGDVFLELIDDARLAVRDGDLARAGRFYDEARELEPENPGLWVDIARLRFRGGEHLTAIEAADYALQLDSGYAPALLLRAQLVRDANGLAESLPWFEAAVAADPRNPEVLADYAATLGDLGRYEDMLVVVRDLASFAPGYPQVHYLQAVLAARANDPVLASTLLDRSGLNGQGVPAAMMLDAVVNLQQGNFDTSAEILLTLSDRQPSNMRVNELLARAWWLGGRDREIVDRFAARAELEEASPYLVMLVGRALERSGERERAIPYIERARQVRPSGMIQLAGSRQGSNTMPAATAELRDFVGTGNTGAAQRIAGTLLERFPQSGDIHALAADTALASGDPVGALQYYEVAARVRRSWPLTRKIIAATREAGDPVAADVLLTRYIKGDPQNTEALLLLAERSAQSEDWLRVAVLLDTAIGLGAGTDLEVLALRARAASELGNEDEAAALSALYGELNPGDFKGG